MGASGATFEPETIELMRTVLEEATAKLPARLRTSSVKLELAELILRAAARGERDARCLRDDALRRVMANHSAASAAEAIAHSRSRPL
jgi:hypothetical protein